MRLLSDEFSYLRIVALEILIVVLHLRPVVISAVADSTEEAVGKGAAAWGFAVGSTIGTGDAFSTRRQEGRQVELLRDLDVAAVGRLRVYAFFLNQHLTLQGKEDYRWSVVDPGLLRLVGVLLAFFTVDCVGAFHRRFRKVKLQKGIK